VNRPRVLEPMCEGRCQPLLARADPDLESHAAFRPGRDAVVLYRPESLAQMLAASESLTLYALAHEYGHYLDITLVGWAADDPWAGELHADAIAGCALARLDLPLAPLRSVFLDGVAPAATRAHLVHQACGQDAKHPPFEAELAAVEAGAQLCRTRVASHAQMLQVADPIVEAAHHTAAVARQLLGAGAQEDPCADRSQ
jgi:hypothetical protein